MLDDISRSITHKKKYHENVKKKRFLLANTLVGRSEGWESWNTGFEFIFGTNAGKNWN